MTGLTSPTRFAEIDGAVLRYRIAGDNRGPAIVFANSLGTDLTIWDPVQARLPAGYAMIGYDKRGHGQSAPVAGAISIADHAADLIGLADHLGLDRFVICGVSVGGMIAQAAAARAPDQVRGVILCNTGAKIGPPAIWTERIAAIEAAGLDPLADAVMERWFTADFRARNPALVQGYRTMLTRTPAAGYAATCGAIRDADLTGETSKLAIPALCIAGREDLATPPALVRELADLVDGAQYLELESCGHIPSVEQPDRTAEAIAGFLASLAPRPDAGPDGGDRFMAGMAVRRRVLGDAHVDRATAQASEIDRRFQRFITEGAWGTVWSDAHFTLRQRSLITLALLAAAGNDEELAMHLRATANTGATEADVAEVMMHVAVYAGVPRANHALKLARQVFADRA